MKLTEPTDGFKQEFELKCKAQNYIIHLKYGADRSVCDVKLQT